MNLYASGEDYVEAILVLYKKFGSVRSVDIARHMEVLSELYTLTKDFCNIIFSKNAAKLDEWINTAQKYDISAIHYSFYNFDFIYTTFCKPLLYEYMIPFFTAVKSFFTPFINV